MSAELRERRLVSLCCRDDVRLGRIGEFWCERCGSPLRPRPEGCLDMEPDFILVLITPWPPSPEFAGLTTRQCAALAMATPPDPGVG